MNRLFVLQVFFLLGLLITTAGCDRKAAADSAFQNDTGPHPASVETNLDAGNFEVDHPEQFQLATAGEITAASELNATGVITPDVSRQVPVISTATGRVVELNARLGDTVNKGQLLFSVRSTDVSGAFSEYQKAVKNEQLTKSQLDRAQLLFDHGAMPKSALEIAQTAEENAKIDVQTTAEHLRLLGSDPNHPASIMNVYAPVSGVITDQQITNAASVQAFGSPNPLTISDLARVWIVCDVYENDLPQVHQGEYADIRLNAYPGKILKGWVSQIGAVLDSNLHTAKIRLEVENPGYMRIGMFVTAIFHGGQTEKHAMVPASAILHLHDRDWVYAPKASRQFQRMEVVAGNMLPGNMQEIIKGIQPGEQIVSNALVLQNTVEQR
jgi:cobalt-zinc-cadmium efflux system membrane fusion protein